MQRRTSTLDEGGKNREHEHPLNKCSLTDLFLSRGIKYNEDRRSPVILVFRTHCSLSLVRFTLDSNTRQNKTQMKREPETSPSSTQQVCAVLKREILVREAKRKKQVERQGSKRWRNQKKVAGGGWSLWFSMETLFLETLSIVGKSTVSVQSLSLTFIYTHLLLLCLFLIRSITTNNRWARRWMQMHRLRDWWSLLSFHHERNHQTVM